MTKTGSIVLKKVFPDKFSEKSRRFREVSRAVGLLLYNMMTAKSKNIENFILPNKREFFDR